MKSLRPDLIQISRRGTLVGIGAFVLGVSIPQRAAARPRYRDHTLPEGNHSISAFVGISPEGTITLFVPCSEMGQGSSTGLAQIVADELDADWSAVKVVIPNEDEVFYSSFVPLPGFGRQTTGGSFSVRAWLTPLRTAGAAAREMLVLAAAKQWGVKAAACTTADSVVSHPDGHAATYGELAAAAAQLPPPRRPALKAPAQFKLIGKSVPREDLRGKVTGQTQFGIDVRLPGMLRACTLASPVFGGRVQSVDDAAARDIPGVVDVLVFDDFVAVIAKTWWPAKKGVEALKVAWTAGASDGLSSAQIRADLLDALDTGEGTVGRKRGKAADRIAASDTVISATYEVPYLEHATMEPMNCTVHVQADRCDVWAPTQTQTGAREAAEVVTGLDPAQIFVHTTYLGGGFGRRANVDYVEMAVRIGKRLDGPVQMLWTREETTRHGFYRPAQVGRFQASLRDGTVEALQVRVAGANALNSSSLPAWAMRLRVLKTNPAEGMNAESPYTYDNVLVDVINVEHPIPYGSWRSVAGSYSGFFSECFIDEIAHALGKDPLALRAELLDPDKPRFRRVLEAVAEKAGWGQAPEGHFQGIAIQKAFESICAQVVEVTRDGDGGFRIHKITAVVDCGLAVNPDQVKAQLMGAALYGISSALGEQVTIKDGAVAEGNFHDYPLMRMGQSPYTFEAHILPSDEPPGGVGEVGTPPSIPALCNAIFAATGKRIRRLPIRLSMQEA